MAEEAPNVAMVWCPNDIPSASIPLYYPGDTYVDWVGIDFYGVYYYENGVPERTDPREKLKIVYDVYSAKKPIMICEWAATHYTERVTPHQDCTQYCIAQMDSLYTNIKAQFPRLKAFCWFSVNSVTTNKNDFSLSDNQSILSHYSQIIQNPYFISLPYRNVPLVKIGITEDSVFNNSFNLPFSVVCDTSIDSISYFINNKRIGSFNYIPASIPIDITNLADNFYTIKIMAFAKSGFDNFETIRVALDKGHKYSVMIMDDILGGSSFSVIGQWNISTSQPDRYGPYYHYCGMGTGSNIASWNYDINYPGYYNLYAYWSAHENRASNAPYAILYKNGCDTIKCNQKLNGGKWNFLGTYYFENNAKIFLNNNADGIVIADAVKLEWCFVLEVDYEKLILADEYVLYQNYPNPFNSATIIKYYMPENSNVKISIYNILGREIAILTNEIQQKGMHQVKFNAGNLSSGVYLCRIEAGKFTKAKKIVLLK